MSAFSETSPFDKLTICLRAGRLCTKEAECGVAGASCSRRPKQDPSDDAGERYFRRKDCGFLRKGWCRLLDSNQ